MSKKTYVHSVMYADFDSGVELSSNMLNTMRYRALRLCGGNYDDNDVIVKMIPFSKVGDQLNNLAKIIKLEESKLNEEPDKFLVLAFGRLIHSHLTYHSDECLKNMSMNDLCERIKKIKNVTNEVAFEMAVALKENKQVPATHVSIVISENSPQYVKDMAIGMHPEMKDQIEHGVTCVMTIENNDVPKDKFFANTVTSTTVIGENTK